MDAVQGLSDVIVKGTDDPGAFLGLSADKIAEQLLGEAASARERPAVDDDQGDDEEREQSDSDGDAEPYVALDVADGCFDRLHQSIDLEHRDHRSGLIGDRDVELSSRRQRPLIYVLGE